MVDEEHLSQEEDQPTTEQFSFGIPDDFTQQRQKPIIELRDLSENDFLDLIDSKNQDKRFYSWLHFQPSAQDIDTDNPIKQAEKQALSSQTDEVCNFFDYL